jgi:hypothetical protein
VRARLGFWILRLGSFVLGHDVEVLVYRPRPVTEAEVRESLRAMLKHEQDQLDAFFDGDETPN